jgi:hypothetical protein
LSEVASVRASLQPSGLAALAGRGAGDNVHLWMMDTIKAFRACLVREAAETAWQPAYVP